MICARCEHFTLKTDPARAAAGLGHCIGFLVAIESFVPWNTPVCRLYRKAKQIEPREAWILQMEAKAKDGNAAAA